MPRKAFNADLTSATQAHNHPLGISAVARGADDGWVSFAITPDIDGPSYEATAMVTDVSDYPSTHMYLLTGEDDMPAVLAQALARVQDQLPPGTNISQLLNLVSIALCTDRDGDSQMHYADSPEDSDAEDHYSEFEDEDEPGQFDFSSDDEDEPMHGGHVQPASATSAQPLSQTARARLRNDLILANRAGFKVGHLGPLLDGSNSYLSIACRVSKLGISEEAMQAWQIQPKEYVILLIRYPKGYRAIEEVSAYNSSVMTKSTWEFRTGIGASYKPTLTETVQAFSATGASERDSMNANGSTSGFRKLFISSPLDDLFQEKFLMLVKYRLKGMSWDGVMSFFHDLRGQNPTEEMIADSKYREEEPGGQELPALVTADHISEFGVGNPLSLPLIAVQFFVRHFVRCTEFCLVCHRKMPAGLEAIKPYVCDGELCLFQYMQLGFGPSIEHEIIAQPRVIDLLISLCYVSARQNVLVNRLPKGIKGKFPPLHVLRPIYRTFISQSNPQMPTSPDAASQRLMRYHPELHELLVDKDVKPADLGFGVGDWIIVKVPNAAEAIHYTVKDIFLPVVKLADGPIVLEPSLDFAVKSGEKSNGSWTQTTLNLQDKSKNKLTSIKNGYNTAHVYTYAVDFDDLTDHQKCEAIPYILELLPSVRQMREYLTKSAHYDLKSWTKRIPPIALGVLRWIIASNRACIMQIGGSTDLPTDRDPNLKINKEERVYGMPGWLQFKFAMGAPEKERRFLKSVKAATDKTKHPYPTLFAWHGSPLGNWHSIIRESLNFSKVSNGRAYGDGVYFAMEASTSMAYSGSVCSSAADKWPLSEINIVNAIALNEIVNAPAEFVSSKPYLVVNNLDWIQTRYLFVQLSDTPSASSQYHQSNASTAPTAPAETPESIPQDAVQQDPKYTAIGPNNQTIVIPITALPKSRRQTSHPVKKGNKKIKAARTVSDPICLDTDDDNASVSTDDEDRRLLLPEPESNKENVVPVTSFVPGQLDCKALPMLKPPEGSAASIAASKRLQSDLTALLNIQEKQPAHELGWYINPELIYETNNLYQWIVELHSFEPHLPLAKDMEAMKITSVVLELRFGKDYPMAPPFVRVIRPRFLPFMHGGGGHVTAGGALCMELLTNNGWSAVSSIESVLLQVRLAMSSMEPKPARLEKGQEQGRVRDYSAAEASDAYIRACQMHGWKVPPGFHQMMGSMSGV